MRPSLDRILRNALPLLAMLAAGPVEVRAERFVAGGWQVIVRRAPPPVVPPRITTGALPSPASPAAPSTTAHQPGRQPSGPPQSGIASYYWQGTETASGERFDKTAMTAAHRTLPFGTRVRVTHVATGRSVVVRINDRGPFKPGRIIDLSERAAHDLGIAAQGLARVTVDVVDERIDTATR